MKYALLFISMFAFLSSLSVKAQVIGCTATSLRTLSRIESNLDQGYKARICVDDTYYSSDTLARLASKGAAIIIHADLQYYSSDSMIKIAKVGEFILDSTRSTYYSSDSLGAIAKTGGTIMLRSGLRYYSSDSLKSIAQKGHLILINDEPYYSSSTLDELLKLGAEIY